MKGHAKMAKSGGKQAKTNAEPIKKFKKYDRAAHSRQKQKA